MRPHRLVPVFHLVVVYLLQEVTTFGRTRQRLHDVVCAFLLERLPDCGARPGDLFQLPQIAHGVPVSVFVRDENPSDQPLVRLPDNPDKEALKGQRALKLREIQHPVKTEVSLLNVDRVLEEDHQLRERRRVHGERVQILEVPLDLGQISPLPPAEELVGVHRHHHVVVRSELGLFFGIARDDGAMNVAFDVLRDPLLSEGNAEAAIHVVAGEPPATDVEPHGRNGLGTVKIVQPEM